MGITGLPNSGKGTFADIAKDFNFNVFVMGDVIRKECEKRGLLFNRETANFVMIELRKEKGDQAIAEITLQWVNEAIKNKINRILIDGIRSYAEVDLFKKEYPQFRLIAIHADRKTRFQRALNRAREDDTLTHKAFIKRDEIELSVGIGKAIALSDYLIDSAIELIDLKLLFRDFLENIIAENKKVGLVKNVPK